MNHKHHFEKAFKKISHTLNSTEGLDDKGSGWLQGEPMCGPSWIIFSQGSPSVCLISISKHGRLVSASSSRQAMLKQDDGTFLFSC